MLGVKFVPSGLTLDLGYLDFLMLYLGKDGNKGKFLTVYWFFCIHLYIIMLINKKKIDRFITNVFILLELGINLM